MKQSIIKYLVGIVILLFPLYIVAQSPSTVKEYQKTFTTYPFSQPDPVPNPTNLYPYFRFDGFMDQPEEKNWEIVELENDFIKVLIMPQIGGKIWTAIDKKNGKPFIYDNDVVKFRDIAMRGPWTSGGIEINYGMIGHTPGVATPVNYLTKENPDGSASCVLSLLDLLTDTKWSLEIRLPKDKAYFITKSTWHNGTGVYQPYYTWMNMAGKVSDSLEYVFPGNHYIGHDGSVHSWPYDEKEKKNISIYNQNDFDGSKSYHVTGTYSQYFGAYWQREDFGMIHYAPRQDKIGKKIFIWGLARSGMIWEDILTDHAGQYTEMQSGRLYNQNAPGSVLSPFKQFYFMPYNTDTWSEYWYPFQNTGGVIAANLSGVFNLKRHLKASTLFISPVSYIHDTLKVFGKDNRLLIKKPVNLKPLQSFQQDLASRDITKVTLAGTVIRLQDSTKKVLDRPLRTDSAFSWSSSYGLFLKGRYASGTKHYREAERYINASLAKEGFFVPALTEMSYLQYRKMNYDSAFYYARKALSIDTYSPAANYYYGLAALRLDKVYDAIDGFQVAAITPQFRSAAYTELSKIQIREKNYKEAIDLAQKSMVNNAKNMTSLQLLYLCSRLTGRENEKIKKEILSLDPLNNFIRFENYWKDKSEKSKNRLTHLIRDELPEQTYLNLAIWYFNLGRNKECKTILKVCPKKNAELLYWLAYLHRKDQESKGWLSKANATDPHFVFPYRRESAKVMQWAMEESDSWKPYYFMALIENHHGHKVKAFKLLSKIKDSVIFAPLYVTRARLCDPADSGAILKDYQMAASLNQLDWRYGKYLTNYLLANHHEQRALKAIEPYFKREPDNYITGMLYVRCLMANDQYSQAERILNQLHILPYEGARRGHLLFKQIKLMLALQQLQKGHYKTALQKVKESRAWPEHLGAGRPYTNRINDDLQDKIEEFIRESKKSHQVNPDQINSFIKEIEAKHK